MALNSIVVPNRVGKLWFVVAVLIIVMSAILMVLGPPQKNTAAIIAIGAAGFLLLIWAIFRVRLSVHFCDAVIVKYLMGERVYTWNEVESVYVESEADRTPITKHVSIASVEHTMIVQLKSGRRLSLSVESALVGVIRRYAQERLEGNQEKAAEAAEAKAASDIRIDLLSGGLFAIVVCIGAFVIAAFQYEEVSNGINSPSWQEVNGDLISAGVQSKVEKSKRGGETTKYEVAVQYKYSVDGKEHVGRQFQFFPMEYGSQEVAMALIQDFKPGAGVKVYVSPRDPELSVLQPGLTPDRCTFLITVLIVGLGAGVYGAKNLLTFRRSR